MATFAGQVKAFGFCSKFNGKLLRIFQQKGDKSRSVFEKDPGQRGWGETMYRLSGQDMQEAMLV